MTRILKRPADAASSLRLPVRAHEVRGTTRQTPAPDTQAEAAQLIDPVALKEELDALREQALREGLVQGRAQAEREFRSALDAELKRSRESLEAVENAVREKLAALEPLAVAIGYEAFAGVLGAAYTQREAIVQSVRCLLEAAASSTVLKVRVAPTQLERVRGALAGQELHSGRRLQFEADPGLRETQCSVVGERGQWETGLEVQLQAIQDALLRAAPLPASREGT